MSSLERPQISKTLELPARKGRWAGETDVLVIGGGMAGLGAALGAAQTGAGVILAERYGSVGGQATASLVTMLASYHTRSSDRPKYTAEGFFPRDHGVGQPVIGGVLDQLVGRLIEAGGAIPPSVQTGYTVAFDPEIFKTVALEMLDHANVKFIFHALASGLVTHGEKRGVVFETKSGPLVVEAKELVDASGDGDVAAWAGAPFAIGRRQDLLTQPMTLYFRMVDFDKEEFAAYVRTHPDQWNGVSGLQALVRQAHAAGDLDLARENILFFSTPYAREVSLNCTRIVNVLGTDVFDLSYAEWQARLQLRQITAFLKKYVPGFQNAYVVQSGLSVGVRETRRILGDYVLTAEDVLSARRFTDAIAHGTYPIDIHNPTGPGTRLEHVPEGQAYDIPLRCLIPRGLDHLMVAGRCISGEHEALASCRVMPICSATGQAAGVTAALAAIRGRSPRQIAAAEVQAELLRQQAVLKTPVLR